MPPKDFVPYAGDVKPIASKEAPGFQPYSGDVKSVEPEGMSWGTVGEEALQNALPSLKGVAEGMIQPVLHPIDTAKNLGDLVKGFISKTGRPGDLRREWDPEPTEEEKTRRATDEASLNKVTEFYKKRYGDLEGFKKAFAADPAAVAMDIGTILSMGAATPLKAGALTKLAKLDPVSAVPSVARKTGQIAGDVGAETLGHLTGGGPEAIKQSLKAGYERETQFLDALFQKTPIEDTVRWAAKAIANMRKERGQQYQTLKNTISKDPTILDFTKIMDARQAVEDVGSYKGIPLSDSNAATRREVKGLLDAWGKLPKDEFHTVEGFDALKKKLGNMLDDIPFEQKTSRKYVGDIKRAVEQEITRQAPDYAKLMKDYHSATEGLEEIEKALSLGDKATFDAGVRKLLSAMRNNANTNYGNRLKMVEALEEHGAKGLKSSLAGAQMSSGFPRGLAGRNPALTLLGALKEPGLLGLLPFESPKLVGRGLYGAGNMAREASDVLRGTILPDAATLPAKIGTSRNTYRGLFQAGRETDE